MMEVDKCSLGQSWVLVALNLRVLLTNITSISYQLWYQTSMNTQKVLH